MRDNFFVPPPKKPTPVVTELQLELEIPMPPLPEPEAEKPVADRPWSLDDYIVSYEL